MSISALKHITYSAAGGLTAGWMVGIGVGYSLGVKKVALSSPGIALAVTSAVARAFDELLKASGWKNHAPLRLIASHIVTYVAILPTVTVIVGYPLVAGRLVALGLTIGSLAVNVLVK